MARHNKTAHDPPGLSTCRPLRLSFSNFLLSLILFTFFGLSHSRQIRVVNNGKCGIGRSNLGTCKVYPIGSIQRPYNVQYSSVFSQSTGPDSNPVRSLMSGAERQPPEPPENGIGETNGLGFWGKAKIDPADSKWAEVKNYMNYRTGRFDQATKEYYALHFDDYREAADCRRCEKYRDFFLSYSKLYHLIFLQCKSRKS